MIAVEIDRDLADLIEIGLAIASRSLKATVWPKGGDFLRKWFRP